jgi:hypothetical protein
MATPSTGPCAGCGLSHGTSPTPDGATTTTHADAPSYRVHPQVVQPTAGSAARIAAPPSGVTARVSVEPVSQVSDEGLVLSSVEIRPTEW